MLRLSLALGLVSILLTKHIRLGHRAKDPAPPEVQEVIRGRQDTPQILPHQLASGLAENDVDLLQGLILGLRHEEQLVEPA